MFFCLILDIFQLYVLIRKALRKVNEFVLLFRAQREAEERQAAEKQAKAHERYLENERRREERKRHREAIRIKYDLAVTGRASTSHGGRSTQPGSAGRRRDRLLDPDKRVGYDSVKW